VLPLVAVVGGLLEVSRLFVQPVTDKINSIMMLAKINFFILLCFSSERMTLFIVLKRWELEIQSG